MFSSCTSSYAIQIKQDSVKEFNDLSLFFSFIIDGYRLILRVREGKKGRVGEVERSQEEKGQS